MNFADFVEQECPALTPVPPLPHGISLAGIEAEHSHDPDWQRIKKDPRWLAHMAETIHLRRLREAGEVPPTYTALRECSGCGPVMLEPWTPQKVEGCPWCLSRAKGLPISRPEVIHG